MVADIADSLIADCRLIGDWKLAIGDLIRGLIRGLKNWGASRSWRLLRERIHSPISECNPKSQISNQPINLQSAINESAF
jgi:hypothetical protein